MCVYVCVRMYACACMFVWKYMYIWMPDYYTCLACVCTDIHVHTYPHLDMNLKQRTRHWALPQNYTLNVEVHKVHEARGHIEADFCFRCRAIGVGTWEDA